MIIFKDIVLRPSRVPKLGEKNGKNVFHCSSRKSIGTQQLQFTEELELSGERNPCSSPCSLSVRTLFEHKVPCNAAGTVFNYPRHTFARGKSGQRKRGGAMPIWLFILGKANWGTRWPIFYGADGIVLWEL